MYGAKIKFLRLAQGRTQDDVAQVAGLEQSQYSRIENNQQVKVSDEILEKIAGALHVKLADLKNQMPVLINHQPDDTALADGNIKTELVKELLCQLHAKDEQISKLLEIITPPEKILNNR